MSDAASLPPRSNARTRPLVWVKRIVLYEAIKPPKVLRQIAFSTGLNLIQGVVEDSNGDFQSGHGTGKTTLCRLIRYCMGEKPFGQRHVVEEVKHAFPNGYVGAEIELDGSGWAVLRPLGNRIKEYAQEGSTLESLLSADGSRRFDSFTDSLATVVLSELRDSASLSKGQSIDWLHVLAMCSRDQEARYDRFWNWRHSRSESGTPRFDKPKVDAGLCARALMGLIDPDEPRLRETLDRFDARLDELRAQIKEKQNEPIYNVNRLRNSLTVECGVEVPIDAPLDENHLLGFPAASERRLEAIRQEVAQIDGQLVPLDREISLASASLLEPLELAEQRQAAAEVTSAGSSSLLNEIEELRSIRTSLRDAQSAWCRYGGVLIGDCSYVRERANRIDDEIDARQQTTLPTVAQRDQAAARMAEEAGRIRPALERIRNRLDELNREKNDLLERRRSLNGLIRRLPEMLAEIRRWGAILEGEEPNTEVQVLSKEVTSVEAERAEARNALDRLLSSLSRRVARVEDRFDAVVRKTLTDEFRGEVRVSEDEVRFGIRRSESLSGEAYETLAILLADLTLLFESTSSDSRHPGILLHDSPREADLNLHIYQRMLDMVEEALRPSGQGDDVPYQYIVTTTTPPSTRLREMSVIKLKLSGGEGSLFGRQLEAPEPRQDGPNLFEED